MITLFIDEQGAKIGKTGERLVISKEDKVLARIRIKEIERIFIFGNVQITTQALSLILRRDLPVAFFTVDGRYKGKLISSSIKDPLPKINQYKFYLNEEFKIEFSRKIVKRKIESAIRLLKKYEYSDHLDFEQELSRLNSSIEVTKTAGSIDSLRGIEGSAANVYFSVFPKLIKNGDFIFNGRSSRPPKDEINSLLSFGYTIFAIEIAAIISAVGLSPSVGLYHSIRAGRPSLALDFLELYRHQFIDPLVLYLVNKRIIRKQDFVDNMGVPYLTEEAREKFFFMYDKQKRERNVLNEITNDVDALYDFFASGDWKEFLL